MRHTIPPRGTEVTEADELARLVPAPNVPELSDDCHDALRRFLVNEIDASTEVPTPAWSRSRRPAFAFTAGALGVTAVVAAAVFAIGHHGGIRSPSVSGTASAPRSLARSGIVRVEPGSSAHVAPVLTQIASVAARQRVPAPRPDQFVYIKSRVAFTAESVQRGVSSGRVLDPVHQREVWIAQEAAIAPADPAKYPGAVMQNGDPQPQFLTGSLRENGETTPLTGQADASTMYSQLAALPTDPDVLLRKIYGLRTEGQAPPDAEAFTYIGDLLRESITPPDVTAALYLAAARIPGVVIVPDAVDAAGRRGFGVARDYEGERYEWIFDSSSMQYLGEREYLVKDTPGGKAGMLTGTTAVLVRGVVDKAGQIPRSSARTPTVGG